MRTDLVDTKAYIGARQHVPVSYSPVHNASDDLCAEVDAFDSEAYYGVFHYDVRAKQFLGMRYHGSRRLIKPALTNVVVTDKPIHADGTGAGSELVGCALKVSHLINVMNGYNPKNDMFSAVAVNIPDPYGDFVSLSNSKLVEAYVKHGAVLLYDDSKRFSHLRPAFTQADFKTEEVMPKSSWWRYIGEVPEKLGNLCVVWRALHDTVSGTWPLESMDKAREDSRYLSQKELYIKQLEYLKINADMFLGADTCKDFFELADMFIDYYADVIHLAECVSHDVAKQHENSARLALIGQKITDVMTIACRAVSVNFDYDWSQRDLSLAAEWKHRCQDSGADKLVEAYLRGVPLSDVVPY